MSDAGREAPPTPPPPASTGQPGPFALPPMPTPPGYYPPAFGYGGSSIKPPRPRVDVGAWLLMAGGAVMIVGSLLTWWTVDGRAVGGMYGDFDYEAPGPGFVLFGLALAGFGIAQLFAGRVKSVAIIAVVVGSLSLIGPLGQISELDDLKTRLERIGHSMSIGPGPWVVLIGAAIALAGAVATLSRKRRWPTPVA